MSVRLKSPPNSGAEPSSIRWTLENETRCGIRAFERPCQLADCSENVEANFPNTPICATDMEYVLVVEDDPEFCENLVEMVEDMGCKAIACASPTALERNLVKAKTGCIILDIKLQGGNGVSVLDWMNKQDATLPVIMLTGMKDPAVAANCIKAGAIDFMLKPPSEFDLRVAIDRAIGISRKNFCKAQSRMLINQFLGRLTPTEKQIATLLSMGYSTKLIAGEFSRSENTIKIHRHRIMAKLKISSVASLANIFNHVRDD